MKYFTPQWWAMEVENPESIVSEYHHYIDSIRSRMSPALLSLHDEVSLHDANIQRFTVDRPSQSVSITLHGYTNPWSQDDQSRRRFDLTYEGVASVETTGGEGSLSAVFDDSDVGYCEIELLPEGLWEHRLLFASDRELTIRFRELRLHCESLI